MLLLHFFALVFRHIVILKSAVQLHLVLARHHVKLRCLIISIIT